MWDDGGITNLTVVIISQYIGISKHYVVYLKLIQCQSYLDKAIMLEIVGELTAGQTIIQDGWPSGITSCPSEKSSPLCLLKLVWVEIKRWKVRLGHKQTNEGSLIPQVPPEHFLLSTLYWQDNNHPIVKCHPLESSWEQGYISSSSPPQPIVLCCSGVSNRM